MIPAIFPRIAKRLAALALFGLAGLSGAQAAQTALKVSAIPDEAPTELQRKFAPLGKYLEKETGMKVEFVPVTDYAAVVESLATGKIDMAWLGGFTYVQSKIRTKGATTPIVQRQEDAAFTSKFITADSSIKTLADLKGKTFAFGAPSSTSGHLMPRYFLQQAGIDPDRDFKTVAYSGAHDATVAFVQAGKVDAGVLNASVWDKLVEQHKVDPGKVRVFAVTPPYFDYNWTVTSKRAYPESPGQFLNRSGSFKRALPGFTAASRAAISFAASPLASSGLPAWRIANHSTRNV